MIALIGWSGVILGMGSANERRHYYVTPSLIGWAHTQNDPCWCSKLSDAIIWPVEIKLSQLVVGSFWVWAQPIRNNATISCRLSLAEPYPEWWSFVHTNHVPICPYHWPHHRSSAISRDYSGCGRYIVTSSLIGWAHTQNDRCISIS